MSEGADKGSSHSFWIDEPDRLRDCLDRFIALLNSSFCGLSSQPFDSFSRRLPGLGQEYPSELPRT
jgi:hypothetical protein